jgi:hypothetical protein
MNEEVRITKEEAADAELWRDKTARQEEEGFIGVIGNSQVGVGSS